MDCLQTFPNALHRHLKTCAALRRSVALHWLLTLLLLNSFPVSKAFQIKKIKEKKKKKERDSDLQTVLSHGCALFRVPWGQAISYQGKKENIHWETCHTNT